MKIDEFLATQHELFSKLIEVTQEAQKEYAHGADTVFANFERVGRYLGQTPQQTLLTYLIKHIDGIAAHAKGHKTQREPIFGRIEDAMVYLSLLYAMEMEEENGKAE